MNVAEKVIQNLHRFNEEWRLAIDAAGKDPLFLADVDEVMGEFKHADAEVWRMIDVMEERRPREEPL